MPRLVWLFVASPLPMPSAPRHPSLLLAGFIAGSCSWNLTAMGASPETLADGLGTGIGTVGLLGGLLWLPHALAQFPSGQLVDRLGVRKVAAVSLLLLAVVDLLAVVAADPAFVGVTRVAAGFFCGGGMLAAAMYARRPTAMGQGVMGAATSVGAAAPLAVVPLVEPLLDWRAPFLVGAALAIGVFVAVLLSEGGTATAPRDARGTLRQVVTDHVLIRLSVLLTAVTMLGWTVGYWIVALLTAEGGFSPVAAGMIGALTLAGGVIGRPLGGWIDSRTQRNGLLVGGSLVMGGACLCAIVAGIPLWAIIPAALAIGICAGLPYAAILHAASTARPGAEAAGLGLVGTAGTLGGVVSIPLVGAAFAAGDGGTSLLALAAVVMLTALAVPLRRGLDGGRHLVHESPLQA